MERSPTPEATAPQPDEDRTPGKQGDGFDTPFSNELTEPELHSVRAEQIRLTDDLRDPFDRRKTIGRRQTDTEQTGPNGEDRRHVPSWDRDLAEPAIFLAGHAIEEVMKPSTPTEKPDIDTLFLAEELGVMSAFEHPESHRIPDVDLR